MDLYKDYELKLLKEVCKDLAKRHYERADFHSNPLIVQAFMYAPHPYKLLRRPLNVLLDPDDPITVAIRNYNRRLHTLGQKTGRRGPL